VERLEKLENQEADHVETSTVEKEKVDKLEERLSTVESRISQLMNDMKDLTQVVKQDNQQK